MGAMFMHPYKDAVMSGFFSRQLNADSLLSARCLAAQIVQGLSGGIYLIVGFGSGKAGQFLDIGFKPRRFRR